VLPTPNVGTREAINEPEAGRAASFNSVEALVADLHEGG
jgi:hypothetical protein